jgi:hypothetical protein
VTTDLNTLLTALYVRIDDYLTGRVRAGRPPRLTDSELLTLATAQVLLGVRSEARGTAPGSVDSLPVRLRPRWKDQHRAQAVPAGVPA